MTACLQGPRGQPEQLGSESPRLSVERLLTHSMVQLCKGRRGHCARRRTSHTPLTSAMVGRRLLVCRWPPTACCTPSAASGGGEDVGPVLVAFSPCWLPWTARGMYVVTGSALCREAAKYSTLGLTLILIIPSVGLPLDSVVRRPQSESFSKLSTDWFVNSFYC